MNERVCTVIGFFFGLLMGALATLGLVDGRNTALYECTEKDYTGDCITYRRKEAK